MVGRSIPTSAVCVQNAFSQCSEARPTYIFCKCVDTSLDSYNKKRDPLHVIPTWAHEDASQYCTVCITAATETSTGRLVTKETLVTVKRVILANYLLVIEAAISRCIHLIFLSQNDSELAVLY